MGMFKTYFGVVSTENDNCNYADAANDYKNDSIALVEASAEQDALIQESNVVDDTIEKVEEDLNTIGDRLEANDAAVAAGGEDQITPAEVAIATQALELRLERLGLNLKDLSSSANISKETFISKENGGLGLKPSDVLRNLHHDMSKEDGILSKIAAGARAIWKAICDMARKIAEFILNLFRSQKAIMENILKKLSPLPDAKFEFDYYKVAPAYAILRSIGPGITHSTITKEVYDSIKGAIDLSNELIKKVNALPQAGEKEVNLALAGLLANYFNSLPEVTISGVKSIPNGTYRISILRKKSASLIVGSFVHKMTRGDFSADDFKKYSVSYEDLAKVEPMEFTRSRCKNVLNGAISTYDESSKYVKAIKDVVNNMEKISVNGDKYQTWITNQVIRMYYRDIITNATKTLADGYDIIISISKEALKDHKATGNTQDNYGTVYDERKLLK